jgi:hypothetical protein
MSYAALDEYRRLFQGNVAAFPPLPSGGSQRNRAQAVRSAQYLNCAAVAALVTDKQDALYNLLKSKKSLHRRAAS